MRRRKRALRLAPRWLLRERDAIYGDVFRRRVAGIGIMEVITSPSSPWQNPYVVKKRSRPFVHLVDAAHTRG
jgi:hypothetical protein